MKTEMQKNAEISSDGRTVWVNGMDGCNIGRFSRNGVDIHHTAEAQMSLGHQCLDCKAGPCTAADWKYFTDGMLRVYGLLISETHKPDNL